jgi:hypothetical protein
MKDEGGLQIADCRFQIEEKEYQSAICNLQSAILLQPSSLNFMGGKNG